MCKIIDVKIPFSDILADLKTAIYSSYCNPKVSDLFFAAMIDLTHFMPLVSFYSPWKQKTRGFLRGI